MTVLLKVSACQTRIALELIWQSEFMAKCNPSQAASPDAKADKHLAASSVDSAAAHLTWSMPALLIGVLAVVLP